jgi:hypothetical protein
MSRITTIFPRVGYHKRPYTSDNCMDGKADLRQTGIRFLDMEISNDLTLIESLLLPETYVHAPNGAGVAI